MTLRYLQEALPVLITYITITNNTPIVTGKFPCARKHATVIPIFKNGDRSDINNYSPVSLLPILSKVLEKIVAQQLSNFLQSNHLIANSQRGFRPNLSTETALLTVTNTIYSSMDDKKLSLLILCDLSKAFDSVNHEMLMEKLTKVKINPFWFRHYLLDSSQPVKIKNTVSTTAPVRFWVPQGSILGPILFTIFTNDLTETISDCMVVQYANDTQFVHSGTIDTLPHLIARAEATLSRAKSYFNNNGLLLTSNTTQCLFVGTRPVIRRTPDNTTINMNNTSITPSKQVKNFGVYMDQHMSFEVHIHEIHMEDMGILLLVNIIRDKFNAATRKIVIQSLALSGVNYFLQVYDTTKNM